MILWTFRSNFIFVRQTHIHWGTNFFLFQRWWEPKVCASIEAINGSDEFSIFHAVCCQFNKNTLKKNCRRRVISVRRIVDLFFILFFWKDQQSTWKSLRPAIWEIHDRRKQKEKNLADLQFLDMCITLVFASVPLAHFTMNGHLQLSSPELYIRKLRKKRKIFHRPICREGGGMEYARAQFKRGAEVGPWGHLKFKVGWRGRYLLPQPPPHLIAQTIATVYIYILGYYTLLLWMWFPSADVPIQHIGSFSFFVTSLFSSPNIVPAPSALLPLAGRVRSHLKMGWRRASSFFFCSWCLFLCVDLSPVFAHKQLQTLCTVGVAGKGEWRDERLSIIDGEAHNSKRTRTITQRQIEPFFFLLMSGALNPSDSCWHRLEKVGAILVVVKRHQKKKDSCATIRCQALKHLVLM